LKTRIANAALVRFVSSVNSTVPIQDTGKMVSEKTNTQLRYEYLLLDSCFPQYSQSTAQNRAELVRNGAHTSRNKGAAVTRAGKNAVTHLHHPCSTTSKHTQHSTRIHSHTSPFINSITETCVLYRYSSRYDGRNLWVQKFRVSCAQTRVTP